ALPPGETPLRLFLADFAESRIAMAGLAVFVAIMLVAIFAPFVSPQDPYDLATLDLLDGKLSPGEQAADGTTYWLGTDDQGRDMLSAIFYGLRTSLAVGVLSAIGALILGTAAGMAAGVFRGRVEILRMRIVDI